ncbi:MAG: hypothetical protein ABIV11_02200 [Gemmatimonadaceae bacterium]
MARVDGSTYVLHEVRIENDSLIGTNAAGSRIAIPTSEISTMDQRRISAKRTAGLIGGTVLAYLVAALIAAAILLASIY